MFELAYRQKLIVGNAVDGMQRIALVDDVCTEGSTIRATASVLKARYPQLEIVAATAGQMTVRAAVLQEGDLTE
jgi:predicted amidophosphoribosyltransferase